MISGTILLQGFLVCVLLMPLLAFWRARGKKKSFGHCVVRAEHAITLPLVTRLRRSYHLYKTDGSPWNRKLPVVARKTNIDVHPLVVPQTDGRNAFHCYR